MRRTIVLLALIVTVASCAVTSALKPAEGDVAVAAQKGVDVTFEQLQSGYNLYVKNCSNCHRLHKPAEFSETKWNKILPEMFQKSKLTNDTEKQRLIRNYIWSKMK